MKTTIKLHLCYLLFQTLLFVCLPTLAHALTIDVFGADEDLTKIIQKTYSPAIAEIYQNMLIQIKAPESALKWKKIAALSQVKQRLLQQMKRKLSLSYAEFEPVIYPDGRNFITIEVKPKQEGPPPYIITTKELRSKPDYHTKDSIALMQAYERTGFQLMLEQKIPSHISCPVHHCTFGFQDPRLKPYLARFNEAAKSEKAAILHTLNHDPEPERQAAAAFLTAHFQNREEILKTLLPHIQNPHAIVRNNVLRVIGEVLEKDVALSPDITPFIALLNSPINTDRNKALLILNQLANVEKNKKQLILEAEKPLLALLKLKQPNNHEPAYTLMKKISGQSFGEYDIPQWEQWFKTQKQSLNHTKSA